MKAEIDVGDGPALDAASRAEIDETHVEPRTPRVQRCRTSGSFPQTVLARRRCWQARVSSSIVMNPNPASAAPGRDRRYRSTCRRAVPPPLHQLDATVRLVWNLADQAVIFQTIENPHESRPFRPTRSARTPCGIRSPCRSSAVSGAAPASDRLCSVKTAFIASPRSEKIPNRSSRTRTLILLEGRGGTAWNGAINGNHG